jgi:hypothetical protein
MFFEESKLYDELNCIKCNQKLDEPRMLPCGEFICASCYISIEETNQKFKCFICNEDHLMPEKGLPISKRLLRILALKSEEVYRSKEVKQLKENLDIIQEDINKFLFGIDNGVDRIKGLCLDLRNKVQLKTEEAIEQLNEHNKQMITEIEEFERECIKSYQTNEKANNEFKITKHELEEFNLKWNEYLKQTVISDEDVSGAIAKSNELSIKSKQELVKLDEFIFNGCRMKFEKNENKLDRSVLGSLMKQQFICESTILSNEQMTELMALCKLSLNQNWKLIYRATRDGFGLNDFHSKCDIYQNTLVIIKSTKGNVFGGYTEQNWSHLGDYKNDPNAFLFSFINKHNAKIIMKCTDPTYAIFAYNQNGPTFGRGCDLKICNNSNTSDGSYSDLGHSYNHPNYACGSKEAKSFLAGSHKFCTTEIEVYTKE